MPARGFVLLLLVLLVVRWAIAAELAIVPRRASIEPYDGRFVLRADGVRGPTAPGSP